MLVVNPKYDSLRAWLEQLPVAFGSCGEIVYDARNQIRFITAPDGTEVCVKRYHKPALLNRFVYSFFRQPKARRAYENAVELLKRGIGTPEPVAYILCGGTLLQESYLVTLRSPLRHTFYEFRNGIVAGKEELIRAFARFSARVHEAGVLHLDYSPGNILYDQDRQDYRFQLVDINRLRFCHVDGRRGCRNFCRLWGKTDFFELLASAYAEARHLPADDCLKRILSARAKFWHRHKHDHFTTDDTFSVGVVVSTYNNPRWLEKTLWGLLYQTRPASEIIIADDGSTDETRELIHQYSNRLPIKHVWHEDNGFRKTAILNKAVMTATADYLIFLDHDLIPRSDFVQTHYRYARKRRFLSGGAIMMPRGLSESITEEDVRSGNLFRIGWLVHHGMPRSWKLSKLCPVWWVGSVLNSLTTAKASWNGGNASTWREYIIAANGFDTRMRYGAEDREFGERLQNSGIRGVQLRYHLPLMHLWHERPYKNQEDWEKNVAIWRDTKRCRRTVTLYGIKNSFNAKHE